MKKALTVIALTFSFTTAAQEKQSVPIPDPGNVTLTLDEFNRLSELANKPPKRPDPPPLPYALKHAELKLRFDNESVFGTYGFEGEVFKKGIVNVQVVSGITVFEARQQNKPLPLQQDHGMQTAVLSAPPYL